MDFHKKYTQLHDFGNVKILKIKTLNIQKASILEKGIGTIIIEYQYLYAIKKYIAETSFDLIIYSTPPISFLKVIKV